MDREQLVSRARNILLNPKQEWPLIAAEDASVAGLYRNYIVWLAALPAIAAFIKTSILGVGVPFVGTVRVGIGAGLSNLLLQYVIGLGVVYLLALLVNALAPSFGGQKDSVQALKATAYASTASWLAGVLVLVPWLGSLLALAGGVYAIYLLYLGLPQTMQCPPERALPYTAVTVIAAIVLGLVFGAITAPLTAMHHGAMHGGHKIEISSGDKTISIDQSKIEAWSKKVEEAGKKLEAAQKSGDTEAQHAAAGEVMGALLGGGKVEALAPERLKPFVPESMGGLERSSYSVKRNTMLGVQIAEAQATYTGEGQRIELKITDTAGAKALVAFAGWAVQEIDSESDQGYEKVYRLDGRAFREEWHADTRSGTYSVLLGERYAVSLNGSGVDMAELKGCARALDLDALEALKDAGVESE